MKFGFGILVVMIGYTISSASTFADYIPPVATLLGLVALIIKYVRDHSVENDQHDHYERIIQRQREFYEDTIDDLRLQLSECRGTKSIGKEH